MDRGTHFSSCSECDVDQIASRLVCSLCEAMAGSLSMNTTEGSSEKVVDSVEVGRSAVYSRYNKGPRTLPWGTTILIWESCVYSVSTFTRKCLLCKLDFRIRK
jgi:hypothetical protein